MTEKANLNMLRELLFIIRMWGRTNEGILPSYTKTAESFDVLAKLFSLLTRLKEDQASNEAIVDECILLPSQVMIPPLDIIISPRGLAHILIVFNRGPISTYFGQEPEIDGQTSGDRCGRLDQNPLIEGAMSTRQFMDNVRHIYLGKKPYVIKECTRCTASSLPPPSNVSSDSQKTVLNRGWDQRWASKCPCGGPWKLSCLSEKLY